MAVGASGVSALFWETPVNPGDITIWREPGVLADGGGPPSSGTVTSVGLALPSSVFDVTVSPITTSGTLTAVFQTQTANTVFAGPATGSAATPTFRSIVTADLPNAIVAGGPIGSGTVVPVITWDAKGRLTAVATASIASGLTVGSTTISGGATTRVLYDNVGVLGEYTNTQLTALINPVTALLSGAIPAFPGNTTTFFRGDGTYAALPGAFTGFANPTASVGLTAVNGSATTAMRSDAAPALASTIVAGGPTGSATVAPIITYNAAGQLTAVSSATITPAVDSITGLGSGVATALGNTAGGAGGFALFGATPPTGTAGGDLAGTYPNPTLNTSISTAVAFSGLAATAITSAASGAVPLTISGYSLTGSQQQSLVSWAGTLNTSGSPDVFKIAITDTARGANTKLFNIYGGAVGATSQMALDRVGFLTLGAGAYFGNNSGGATNVTVYTGASGAQGQIAIQNSSGNNVAAIGLNAQGTANLPQVFVGSNGQIGFAGATTLATAADVILTRGGAAVLVQGAVPAASPVAQTFKVQDASTGNNNGAATFTFQASASVGNGASGDMVFQTGKNGNGSGALATQTTALTIKGETQAVVIASGKTFQLGNAAVTGLVAGALAALTNASIVLTDSTGTAYRIPCTTP